MKTVLLSVLVLGIPVVSLAQKREIQDLQRDVAQLQDQVRALQRSLDEKLSALTTLVQQTLDSANKADTAVAALQSNLTARLGEQSKNVGKSVTDVTTTVGQMSDEFRGVREALTDMNSRLGKLETKIVDLGNTVRTLNAPPPPPPAATGTNPLAPTTNPATGGPPPGLSAETTYENGRSDYLTGKYDLAMQEFTQYLRYFGDTSNAPSAQFWIGEIYRQQGDLDNAVKAYDLVLEKYPDNQKTPDALLMKGKTLVQAGQRNAARQEFNELMRRFPGTSQAAQARDQLKLLGVNPPPASKGKTTKKRD